MKRFNCNVISEDEQGEYMRYEDVRHLLNMKIQRLELHDGDVIVIKHMKTLTAKEKKNIAEVLKKALETVGHNAKAIVFEDGMDIAVAEKVRNETILTCDHCKGRMIFTDEILTSSPPLYVYRCENCGRIKKSAEAPIQIYDDLPQGKHQGKLVYNLY